MQLKNWRPDTCECKIEEQVHDNGDCSFSKVLRKCEAHQFIPDNKLYSVIMSSPNSEQKRKNWGLARIKQMPESIYALTEQDKKTLKLLLRVLGKNVNIPDTVQHPDKEIMWSFDEQRNLVIQMNGFLPEDKVKARGILEKDFTKFSIL